MTGRRSIIFLLFISVILLLFFWPVLNSALQRNRANLITLQGLRANDPAALQAAANALRPLQARGLCRVSWKLSIVYAALGDLEQRDLARQEALRCSADYIQLSRVMDPQNRPLAEFAVQAYPDRADAWFWMGAIKLKDSPEESIHAFWQGIKLQPDNENAWRDLGKGLASLDIPQALQIYEQLQLDQLVSTDPLLQTEPTFIMAYILSESQPEQAIQLYRQGLQLKPYDGVRWYELGDLLREIDAGAALDAYHQACFYGDPGSHGCYGAGLMAEALGNYALAVRYYRRSTWEGALAKAAALEQSLP